MDAFAYFKKHGRKTCERVAKKAGSEWSYFKQLIYGVRSPSKGLAPKLVKASERLTPDDPLDLQSLLYQPPRAPRKAPPKPQSAAQRCA